MCTDYIGHETLGWLGILPEYWQYNCGHGTPEAAEKVLGMIKVSQTLGWYAQWSFQLIPNALDKSWIGWEIKEGPLLDPRNEGTLYLGMSSSNSFFTITFSVSYFVENVSSHPEKKSTKTNKYLYPYQSVSISGNFPSHSLQGQSFSFAYTVRSSSWVSWLAGEASGDYVMEDLVQGLHEVISVEKVSEFNPT